MNYETNNKKTFADRLNEACTNAGIPVRGRAQYIQDRLSVKISRVAVRKWLVGDAIPETKRLGEIADIVHSSVEELLGSEVNTSKKIREEAHSKGVVLPALKAFEVPVLSWSQVSEFCNSDSPDISDDCETILCPNKSASKRTFALRVVGDSMTNPYGRTYSEGSVIFVDPEKEAAAGQRVVARTGQGHAFKELAVNELGEHYLKSLNPHHQPIFNDGIEICGVVIGCYVPE
ncbi:S24 family peptidase [Vibrio sp. JC009]|uniref:LexA family protein n=1 Tax=Vibrio sp. JC009 TaxID=2912314 RepID=UPI0023AF56BC|nr:S24 family peptidase [Vibrio sp. JC009]WED23055.1 S24 family peptidase [Vibrio sp. JC009]